MSGVFCSRRHFLVLSGGGMAATLLSGSRHAGDVPAPWGATPSSRQRMWQNLETYGFLHFSINTFTDREWGLGDEDPKLFNPTDFDPDQICAAFRAGGLKQLILTAKHHDGFCLWPSRYTEHSIKNSPFQNGKGDIVRDMAEACARHGLKFGIYLSPWDRNRADYASPSYVEYYLKQLHELLTGYGKVWEVWFDGANGGDGYYGGAREVRHIDAKTYYQWDRVRRIVRTLQPDAVMMADAGMDVRWVGNEAGKAGDPCWPTVDATPFTEEKGNHGVRGGPIWDPAETDVSIRPGWFWHKDENDQVRSPANLLNLYLGSVGHGSNLLLNVPPDRRGQICEADVTNLTAFRKILDTAYAKNFADGARYTASSTFSSAYGAEKAQTGNGYWAAKTDDRAGAWLQLDLKKPVRFDLIRLREELALGVRVDTFAIEAEQNGQWVMLAQHTCISAQRLIRLKAPVTAKKVRLRIISAAASPAISEFSLYLLPDVVEEPKILRDKAGMVTLTTPGGGAIFYTLDGSVPDHSSVRYTKPILLKNGGVVRAIAISTRSDAVSTVTTARFDISQADWIITGSGQQTPDGSWRGPEHRPLELTLDLGKDYVLTGFTLTPEQPRSIADAARFAPPSHYKIWCGISPEGAPMADGEFANIAASRTGQKIAFTNAVRGRYLHLVLSRPVSGKAAIAIAAIGVKTH